MGIKSLNKFLHQKCPNIFEKIHLSRYKYKKIAIDISLYLCTFKAKFQDKWLFAFVQLVSCLRINNVHCVFIYDSGYPVEKEPEKKERWQRRQKLQEQIFFFHSAIEKYHQTQEIDQILLDLQKRRKLNQTRLLTDQTFFNIDVVENIVQKMSRQLFSISAEDYQTTKELLDILDVPYFHAPEEAETMCADLCLRKEVDAALSNDSDILAYGTPIFLTNINISECSCICIDQKKMLQSLNFTRDQFLDFCIMCGTDYNKNIFRLGPAKAYNLLAKYKNIETIVKQTNLDVKILNHVRIRELFSKYKQNIVTVSYCGCPNFEKLVVFLAEKNIFIPVDVLKKSFSETNIIFDSEKESFL